MCFLIGTCFGAMSNEIEILEKENERLRQKLISLEVVDEENDGSPFDENYLAITE